MLEYHVANLTYCSAGLISYNSLKMLNGDKVSIKVSGGRFFCHLFVSIQQSEHLSVCLPLSVYRLSCLSIVSQSCVSVSVSQSMAVTVLWVSLGQPV